MPDLTAVGITADDEPVYRVLLDTDRHLTVDQLAAALDQPTRAVEDAIERLQHRGFVADDDHGAVTAVPACVAVTRAAARREQVLLDQLAAVRRARSQYTATALPVDPSPHSGSPFLGIITDPGELHRWRSRVAAMAVDTLRRTVVDDAPLPEHDPDVVRFDLYQQSALTDATRLAAIDDPDRGHQVHVVAAPLPPLLIADTTVALFELGPSSGFVLYPSRLLDALHDYFALLWRAAVPIGARDPEGAWQLDQDRRRLLRLLATGAKDQAIAHLLGLGLRTVTRQVGELLRAFDVETRFQLGVQAAVHDLL
ncbi:MAG TPA: hypothetical protein VFQ85_08240 [Mycobacteriales bacterium]|jgi:predicted DNA-binding transcriptional regulator|nr:hypothetical protein [Mycobacteriales bacterium]